ncbi:DoxX family protein [Chloropicon primus]|uniref:DoxX domain-containing protein n=1 Tax=Chloropicon primus TaxID=1764295 RepID=A0A5B8MSE0_9CHLO|nr:hypothetical protein A3770_07p47500 [Chloropicon primus]UPR01450.1 DoxX family protein [Chloropicon primus]|eukprot:QDZ22232.1 hypothetical protein A3770_07p47500 [Chloropicon primus]
MMASPATSTRAARRILPHRVVVGSGRRPAGLARAGGEGGSQQGASEPFNLPAELGILSLRLGTSVMMFHNGLDKLKDPEGFSTFVVEKYLDFLPFDTIAPLLWTYGAITAELACPVLLALGVLGRPSAAALLTTMGFAIYFHLNQTGLEGFPLGVVEAHQYAFETSSLYAGIFFYFLLAGPGKLSLGGGKKE